MPGKEFTRDHEKIMISHLLLISLLISCAQRYSRSYAWCLFSNSRCFRHKTRYNACST